MGISCEDYERLTKHYTELSLKYKKLLKIILKKLKKFIVLTEKRQYNKKEDRNAYTTFPAISPEPYPTLLYHFKYVFSCIKNVLLSLMISMAVLWLIDHQRFNKHTFCSLPDIRSGSVHASDTRECRLFFVSSF